VEFKGNFYDRKTQEWEEIKFFLSEIKDANEVQRRYFLKG
jgi:hypothetical protein